jgi:hypothetical protein
MPAVSRETSAQTDCIERRRYRSPARRAAADEVRAAIVKAALDYVELGNFRPTGVEIAARAGVHSATITHRFGSIMGLYRAVAEEHPAAVAKAAGLFFTVHPIDQPNIVWLLMTGTRPGSSSGTPL